MAARSLSSRYMFFPMAPRKVSTSYQSRKRLCSMCQWPDILSIFPTYSITFSPMRMSDVPTAVHDIPVFCINSESWTVWQGHLALLEATLSQWSKGQPESASMLLTIGIYLYALPFLPKRPTPSQSAANTNPSPTFQSFSQHTPLRAGSSKTPTSWPLRS